jgi:hypothetical protein
MVYHVNIPTTDKLMYRNRKGRSVYSPIFMCIYLNFLAFDKFFPPPNKFNYFSTMYSKNNADNCNNNRRMKADFKCSLWGGKQVFEQSKFAQTSESKQ